MEREVKEEHSGGEEKERRVLLKEKEVTLEKELEDMETVVILERSVRERSLEERPLKQKDSMASEPRETRPVRLSDEK